MFLVTEEMLTFDISFSRIINMIMIYFTHYGFDIQDNKIWLTSSNKIHRIVKTLNRADTEELIYHRNF